MTDPCRNCTHNHDGTINVRHCVETLCEVANSGAFKQLVQENNRLLEERKIIDKHWQQEVMQTMDELKGLLDGRGK